ncbi:MAG TPA: preprotein translocase subunit TatB [Micromonosporaceae bacterium]|nr:preprotein translocase subunit TatB [Micromonosporaceae bacterium]
MLENLSGWELGALLIIALLVFGDKLPTVIADGLRMLRNLRRMATSATGDLSRELGTDIQLTDLHPKTFLRKHLLSEEDEAALRRPLDALQRDLKDVADSTDLRGRGNGSRRPATSADGSAEVPPAPSTKPRYHERPYDFDAT